MADDLFNATKFRDDLDSELSRIIDPTPIMPDIMEIVIFSIEQNFLEGGRYSESAPGEYTGGVNKWIELAPSTKEWRTKHGYSADKSLLQRTGGMASAFQWFTHEGSGVISNTKEYFPRLNFGFAGPDSLGRNISTPARPMLVIQDEDIDEIVATFARKAQEK